MSSQPFRHTTMQIRALTPQDASSFQALRLRGLQECPEAFASSYEEEFETPLAEIERSLQPKPDAVVFGAFDAHGLVALLGLQRESMTKLAHKALIWGVYVAPEARGRGIGTYVLRHALDYAANVLQVRQVNLGVNTRNTAALSLYKKLGFVPFGLERAFMLVDGEFQDECHMVRLLAGAANPHAHDDPTRQAP
jgi:RimJ/RimL family protein N-acetyltransferase